jgi:hypothetical protein
VTLDGEPAAGVTVTFFPAPPEVAGAPPTTLGNGGSGTTDASGKFEAFSADGRSGIPVGTYRVLFSKVVKPDGTPLGPDEMAADANATNILPEVYGSPTETPIGADVPAAGTSALVFALDSK